MVRCLATTFENRVTYFILRRYLRLVFDKSKKWCAILFMTEQKKECCNFDNLGIAEKLLSAIKNLGLEIPTPIQHKAIPAAIEGKDLIGIAQTGTGKTLAFCIPMIQRLALYKGRGLVLLPTRELAQQIDESVRKFGAIVGVRTALFIGGESIHRQREALRRNPHILIATPGRMNDFISRGWIKLDDVKILVLDEADMMLDMGFAPQIETIIKEIPRERQTMLFSATMPNEIIRLAARHMAEPIRVEVAPTGCTAEGINQEIFIIHKADRVAQLEKLLKESAGSVLIFCRTKRGVEKLAGQIQLMGYNATEIHSNRSLEQRRKALAGFKSGKFRVLVATDIAARGIDVKDIELVLNFDLPEDPGDYVHRIGRTGRAGKTGKAISFAGPEQSSDIRQIERLIDKTLPLKKLAQFQAVRSVYSSSKSFRHRPTGKFKSAFGKTAKPFNRSAKPFEHSAKSFNHSAKFFDHSAKPLDHKPGSYFGANKVKHSAFRPASGFSKYKQEDSRSDSGFKKFKPRGEGYSSGFGANKFKPARPAKSGFYPAKSFTERPAERIMTDKERFRASLREGSRPSFGYGRSKTGGNRRSRGFRN